MSSCLDFDKLNIKPGNKEDVFESFCCKLARAMLGSGYTFEEFYGKGGDGGVEMIASSSNEVIDIQAKFVHSDRNLKTQASASFRTAIKTYPQLNKYYIYFPFDYTGKTSRGEGSAEKLRKWKSSLEDKAREKGLSIEIVLKSSSDIENDLIAYDKSKAIYSYFFDKDNPCKLISWYEDNIAKCSRYDGMKLDFYDYNQIIFEKQLEIFLNSKGQNRLIVTYRYPEEAFYVVIALLKKLGHENQVRIVDDDANWDDFVKDDNSVYVIKNNLLNKKIERRYKVISFYDKSLDGQFYTIEMKSCSRSLMISKLIRLGMYPVPKIESETQFEYPALNEYIFNTLDDFKLDDKYIPLLLLRGWTEADEDIIFDYIKNLNLEKINAEYGNKLIIKRQDTYFDVNKLCIVNVTEHLRNLYLDAELISSFESFVLKIFESPKKVSSVLIANLIESLIWIDERYSLSSDTKFKVLNNSIKNENVSSDILSLCVELAPVELLEMLQSEKNIRKRNNLIIFLKVLLTDEKYMLNALSIMLNAYYETEDNRIKRIIQNAFRPENEKVDISPNQIERLLKIRNSNLTFSLLIDFLNSSGSIDVIDGYEIRNKSMKRKSGNAWNYYCLFFRLCISNISSIEELIEVIKRPKVWLHDKASFKDFFNGIISFLNSTALDQDKLKIELAIRKCCLNAKDMNKEIFDSLSMLINRISYQNKRYKVLWLYCFPKYYYINLEHCSDYSENAFFNILTSNSREIIMSIDAVFSLVDLIECNRALLDLDEAYSRAGYLLAYLSDSYSGAVFYQISNNNVLLDSYLHYLIDLRKSGVDVLLEVVPEEHRTHVLKNVSNVKYLSEVSEYLEVEQAGFWQSYTPLLSEELNADYICFVLDGFIKYYDVRILERLSILFHVYYKKIPSRCIEYLRRVKDVASSEDVADYSFAYSVIIDSVSNEVSNKEALDLELFYYGAYDAVRKGKAYSKAFNASPDVLVDALAHIVNKDAHKNEILPDWLLDCDYQRIEDLLVPCFCPSGSCYDNDAISEWLKQFNAKLLQIGLQTFYYHFVGRLLARSPKDSENDKLLNNHALVLLENLLSEDSSTYCKNSFVCEMFNLQGPMSGYSSSKELVCDKYRRAAESTSSMFPSVSELYEYLANKFDDWAKKEDDSNSVILSRHKV